MTYQIWPNIELLWNFELDRGVDSTGSKFFERVLMYGVAVGGVLLGFTILRSSR